MVSHRVHGCGPPADVLKCQMEHLWSYWANSEIQTASRGVTENSYGHTRHIERTFRTLCSPIACDLPVRSNNSGQVMLKIWYL